MKDLQEENIPEGVAIIGMVGRFPGAQSVETFWQNICDGTESIIRLAPDEDYTLILDPTLRNNPQYVPAGAFLDHIDLFDAAFFGYTPREAQIMDPQHRLFLECAWEALERAGYDAHQYNGRISIYAGSGMNSYFLEYVYPNQELLKTVGISQLMISSEKDFLATRVAYKLGLKGPAITVQTACSTSLTATTLAFQSLVNYQSDIALAGGVSLPALQRQGYLYEKGGIASPDGHCRAFDADARGTVVGSGLGIVVLKRLEDALNDGDQIYAVIKGVAINNDGDDKIGFTAPGVAGQAEVITEALVLAGFEPESIGYIETHGTGTSIGDPIEIAALKQAFHIKTQRQQFCALGSVKTNIGHLDTAAGVAGLIKTSLALKHALLPPSLHFTQANPHIDFVHSPFYVNTKLTPWLAGGMPRRAGVSSFGIGGTNVHVVLEEAPQREKTTIVSDMPELVLLSAKTSSALTTSAHNLAAYLQHHPELPLADVAYTLHVGRRAFSHRLMLVSQQLEEVALSLQSRESGRVFSSVVEPGDHTCIFLFSGQGAPYRGVGKQLYAEQPVYRQWIDYCATQLLPFLKRDLRLHLFSANGDADSSSHSIQIDRCAIFVTEYATARLLETRGIRPAAMIGQDLGEYTAACLAGVIALDDVLALIAEQGRLMDVTPPDTQLNVHLSEKDLLSLRIALPKIHLHPPHTPYISCSTGTWITKEQACDPEYWARHAHSPTHFSDSLHLLFTLPQPLFLEIGPVQVSRIVHTQIPATLDFPPHAIISTMRTPHDAQSDRKAFLTALGKLWLHGFSVDLVDEVRSYQRVLLPTYPFERRRYWLEAPLSLHSTLPSTDTVETPISRERTEAASSLLLTNTQRRVLMIWQEYLGDEDIDIHANFFELGGHSLLAIRLVSRLCETFNIELSVQSLYEKQTIAELSQFIDANQVTPHRHIVSVSRSQLLPASWKQQWMWTRAHAYPADASRENLAIGWELHGHLDGALFEQSIKLLVQRHETLRTSFVMRGEHLCQVITPLLTISIPVIDLTQLPEEEKEARLLHLGAEQEQTPFLLSHAPLWRMMLFNLGEERSAWILVAHRSIWDGISTHRIQEELNIVLRALMQQQSPSLPPMPIQFADFAAWEQQRFQGKLLQEYLTYWRNKLGDDMTPLRLPTDRPRLNGYARSIAHDWHIPETLAHRLHALGRQQGTTLFMTLLAALDILCHYYTQQKTILLETSFSNRDQPELVPLVGSLTNIVPLCMRLDGNPTFLTLLSEVRTTVIEAMSHRDLHFSRVLAELFPDIATHYSPFGRILIAQYEAIDVSPSLPDLTYHRRLWFRRATNDLYISIIDQQSSIQIICEYDTYLFRAETITHMITDYIALLESIVTDPESTLDALTHWLEQRSLGISISPYRAHEQRTER